MDVDYSCGCVPPLHGHRDYSREEVSTPSDVGQGGGKEKKKSLLSVDVYFASFCTFLNFYLFTSCCIPVINLY